MKTSTERMVRQARGGGRWFPGNPKQLAAAVDGFMREAKPPEVPGRIVGAIAPHAGYQYSGKVAGYTFRAIRDGVKSGRAPETVVVLGFSHQTGFRGVALMDGDAIATPLKETSLDVDAGRILTASNPLIRFDCRPHADEHSAENEIPFIQAAAPEAKLVIAIIGDHDAVTLDALTAALVELAKKKKILVVASTDLLHDADYDRVTRTDKLTMEQVAALDYSGIVKRWSYSAQVCCGIGPVMTVMRFAEAQGCKQGTVLDCRNSGDDYPESRGTWVVGYGAAVFAVPE